MALRHQEKDGVIFRILKLRQEWVQVILELPQSKGRNMLF